MEGDNFVFTKKTKIGRERVVAKPQPARYPEDTPPNPPGDDREPAPATVVPPESHRVQCSPAVLMRFVGLLALLVVAVSSLVFAVTQSSARGIVLMIVTTAITGICSYFSWQEYSNAKQARKI
jgi:hypothetical protein